jgi:hypothetical protein
MVDILHKVGIKSSSLDDAYKALTTLKGLSGWWTNDTRGGRQSRRRAPVPLDAAPRADTSTRSEAFRNPFTRS